MAKKIFLTLFASLILMQAANANEFADVGLSWTCPTMYDDQTTPLVLTEESRIIVIYRQNGESLWRTLETPASIESECVESYTLEDLSAGQWVIGVAFQDENGLVSDVDNVNFTHDGSLGVTPIPFPGAPLGVSATQLDPIPATPQQCTETVVVKCQRIFTQ